jgi:hypothetical protein
MLIVHEENRALTVLYFPFRAVTPTRAAPAMSILNPRISGALALVMPLSAPHKTN